MQVFVTVCAEDVLQWRVSVPWQKRRELHALEAIDAGGIVDTTRVLNALFPECILGWSREGALDEEAFWSVEFIHLYRLASLVGAYLFTGVNASPEIDAEGRLVGRDAEGYGEADPFAGAPSSSGPAETATTSTPSP